MNQGAIRKLRRSPHARLAMMATALVMTLVVACSGGGGESAVNDRALEDEVFLFLISSDAGPGENRMPFALRRADGGRVDVDSGAITLQYRHRDSGPVQTAPAATFRQWPVGNGIFTTQVTYDRAGLWDFTVTLAYPDGTTGNATATTLVKEVSSTPAIGSRAPATASKTGTTPEELALITSAQTPIPEMYAVSFDDALETGRPVVVTFSTPAWCTSQTCGPQVDTVDEVRRNHIGEASFIHIELFDNPAIMRESGDPSLGVDSPVVEPWGLPSEPWTFIVDGDGLIAAKFEAYTTSSELEEALAEVLGSG
ncbi:MAG: hypothetical protein IIB26_02300 [Chloroflexi bacterium]|nr:hypothetical protein [Chloroflexota bacterium]